MPNISFTINPTVLPKAICDLREAVGWERQEADYPTALQGYWATVGGFDASGTLLAWCAILSDGVRHAVLLDVIVHPSLQRQGIGKALVGKAITHIQEHGISIIHVDFEPETTVFYESCGFRVGLGGIYDDTQNG
jgi:ribosomal protein S18 acetylase RimI-like enzyme